MKKYIFVLGMMIAFNVQATCDEAGYYDCGDTGDVRWYLSDDQTTLTISGKGSTASYSLEENPYFVENDIKTAPYRTTAPWGKYNNKIETINVESGVTSLGDVCFGGLDHVKSVNLPETLLTIGSSALDQLSSLTTMVIPNSVSMVKVTAFAWTNSLTTLDVGDGFDIDGSYNHLMNLGVTPPQHQNFAYNDMRTTIYCEESMLNKCLQMEDITRNTIAYRKVGNEYILDGVRYKNSLDMQKGQNGNKIKRIYTIDEANAVAGKTNRISIKYR